MEIPGGPFTSDTSKPRHANEGRARVVIVGAGFGGLAAARKLLPHRNVAVTMVDRHNYHLFQPLLYQVAMAGLSPGEIAAPVRMMFSKHPNCEVLMGEVKSIDAHARSITTDFGSIPYDYLILAAGAQHSYFGHEAWEPFAPGLKTLEQATEVRRRVLLSFELAERERDPRGIERLLTFVIVGGGPTGVELAGALAEISRYTLKRAFRHIDPRRSRIILIEAGPQILPSFAPELSARASADLKALGVSIRVGARVTEISAAGVRLGQELIEASTVLWAAGVKPSALGSRLGVPLDSLGRVIVEKDLSVPGHPEIFVIGDQTNFSHTESGKPLPGLAPVAMQQGRHAAANILASISGRARHPFRYNDKGQMATIGRRKAIVETGRIRFGGFFAWYTWLLVHIFYLIGFKNRVMVLIQWAWAYFTFKRGAQLIITKDWRSFPDRSVHEHLVPDQLDHDQTHTYLDTPAKS